jgi:hypothetical protein
MASDNVAREVAVAAEEHRRIVPVVVRPVEMTGNVGFEIAGLQQISFADRPFDEAFDQLSGELGALDHVRAPVTAAPKSRPERTRSRRRPVVVVASVVALLIVLWIVKDARNSHDTTVGAPTAAAATATASVTSGPSTAVPLKAKVWFAGFEIGVDRATYDSARGKVTIDATFLNDQAATANVLTIFIDNITALEWQQHRATPYCTCGSLPPGATERDELVVDAPAGFRLAGAALVFGDPEQHHAIVPLDGKPATSERPVTHTVVGKIDDGAGTTFSVERVDVVPAACHGMANELGYVPASADEMSVVAWGTAVTSKDNIGYGNAFLVLKDGTRLASSSLNGYVYVMKQDQPEHHVGVCFRVPNPVAGQYRLIVTAVNVTPLPAGLVITL